MPHALPAFKGVPFLGGRSGAQRLRREIEAALAAAEVVSVDFQQVEGVSHGFVDELLAPLSEEFGARLSARVAFVNCASDVVETIQVIAAMHRLSLPAFA